MAQEGFQHTPVLVEEVVSWLQPALQQGGWCLDATLGLGGHAEALLERLEQVMVLGLDRDAEALEVVRQRLQHFGERVVLAQGNYAGLAAIVEELQIEPVRAVLYDLGVSSGQLDTRERGFGYRSDAPLDMRMDRSQRLSAEEVVNTYSHRELARVIGRFGEERFASRIAAAIVRRRHSSPFHNTQDLAEVVKGAIPAATRRTGPHPARRTFMALRIEVNRELESLEQSLPQAAEVVIPGARVAVISYHSLEDRIVKNFFVQRARGCTCPRDLPVCACGKEAEFRVLTRRPVRPTPEEVAANPRSDSARLRVAMKLGEAG